MAEVIVSMKQITDEITVMRDGQYVGTVRTKEAEMIQIVGMMVGRVIFNEQEHVNAHRLVEFLSVVNKLISVYVTSN